MSDTKTTTAAKNELYQEVIAKARTLARDTLRTRNIHTLIREKAEIDRVIAEKRRNVEEAIKEAKLNVARMEFRLSQVNEADPDRTETIAGLTELLNAAKSTLQSAEALQDDLAAEAAQADTAKAELDTRIAKWETGESKVQLDNVNTLSREYIETYFQELAKKLS